MDHVQALLLAEEVVIQERSRLSEPQPGPSTHRQYTALAGAHGPCNWETNGQRDGHADASLVSMETEVDLTSHASVSIHLLSSRSLNGEPPRSAGPRYLRPHMSVARITRHPSQYWWGAGGSGCAVGTHVSPCQPMRSLSGAALTCTISATAANSSRVGSEPHRCMSVFHQLVSRVSTVYQFPPSRELV